MHKYSLLHIYPEGCDSTSAFIQLKQERPTSTDNILGEGEAPPLWLKAITLPINWGCLKETSKLIQYTGHMWETGQIAHSPAAVHCLPKGQEFFEGQIRKVLNNASNNRSSLFCSPGLLNSSWTIKIIPTEYRVPRETCRANKLVWDLLLHRVAPVLEQISSCHVSTSSDKTLGVTFQDHLLRFFSQIDVTKWRSRGRTTCYTVDTH